MPEPSGAGAHPSGDAIARRFGADSHSAIGAGSISRPAGDHPARAHIAVRIGAADRRQQETEPRLRRCRRSPSAARCASAMPAGRDAKPPPRAPADRGCPRGRARRCAIGRVTPPTRMSTPARNDQHRQRQRGRQQPIHERRQMTWLGSRISRSGGIHESQAVHLIVDRLRPRRGFRRMSRATAVSPGATQAPAQPAAPPVTRFEELAPRRRHVHRPGRHDRLSRQRAMAPSPSTASS